VLPDGDGGAVPGSGLGAGFVPPWHSSAPRSPRPCPVPRCAAGVRRDGAGPGEHRVLGEGWVPWARAGYASARVKASARHCRGTNGG